jgi:hypothetical protein
MRKLGFGCAAVVTVFVVACLLILLWAYITNPTFLDSIPAPESICGTWLIDPDLTTGYEGSLLLRAGDQREACLELKPDRRFTIQAMPNFWAHTRSSDRPSSASGTWRWEKDNNGWVMLNLYFEQVGDKTAGDWDWGHSYVRQEKSGYRLYFIMDFDSRDFFVLRKSQ